MSRARFDFHAEDGNGNSIVNAKVNIYAVGTTTAVTDLYSGASGGSPVTFLLSGADGMVTGYLTTPKDVDCNVTDNGGTATITGITGNRNFTAYTKTRSVPPAAADSAIKPAASDAVIYVSQNGTAANDGFSWGSAKATVAAGLAALPAGGGSVIVGAGTFAYTTALSVPVNVQLVGLGYSSHLVYGGAGHGIDINPGTGSLTNWESAVRNLRLTTSSGTAGIYLKDVGEVDILDNHISGWSAAGVQSDPTAGQGVIAINIHRNKIKANGAGVQFVGANAQFQWSIIGNRIQGSTAGPGLDFPHSIQGIEIAGNDIEGNTTAEIFFGNDVMGAAIHGNYMENATPAAIAIAITGSGTVRGLAIEGNIAANTGATPTGPFFYCTSSGVLSGIQVHANRIAGYGAGSAAFEGGGKSYANSDFSGNDVDHSNIFDAFGATVLDKHEVLVSLDFGLVANGATADLTTTIAGLPSAGAYSVVASPVGGLDAGLLAFGFVSAADTVTVRLQNSTGGGYNPGARLYMISVTRHA